MTTGDLIMAPITVATSTFGTAVSIVDSTVASIVGHDLDAQQKKEATDAVIREQKTYFEESKKVPEDLALIDIKQP